MATLRKAKTFNNEPRTSKGLTQSRTFWGATLAILSGLLSWASTNAGAVESLILSVGGSPEAAATVLQVLAALGGVVAIWGRAHATRAIHGLCLCLLCIPFVGGCAGLSGLSDAERYAVASETFRATVDSVTEASRAGAVDVETLQEFRDLAREGDAALDVWEAAILSGASYREVEYWQRIIQAMIRIRIESETKDLSYEPNRGIAPFERYPFTRGTNRRSYQASESGRAGRSDPGRNPGIGFGPGRFARFA